ncbi:hypothetical protein HWI79_3301 [Cryptosporidium felis]|nr:hypothetical protein HWI79_3301 [Cryptosporidium felis]
MKTLPRFHSSGGRTKTIIKRAPIETWHALFDKEITNSILQHKYVDQFTWIKPDGKDKNLEESFVKHLSKTKYFLFENIFPNSIFSIPFIQSSIIENNGVFISSPKLQNESSCSISIFHKEMKTRKFDEKIFELIAIIRTPNLLYSNAINIDKFLKLPPHMKKINRNLFLKIELSDKSFWNDKLDFIYNLQNRMETLNREKCFDPVLDKLSNLETELKFHNPLIGENEKILRSHDIFNEGSHTCISCQTGTSTRGNGCHCNVMYESDSPPEEPQLKGLSYYTRGLGNNPFYSSIQSQFSSHFFTNLDFLGYFESEKLLNKDYEHVLLDRLETILRIAGSHKAKVIPVENMVINEKVDRQILTKSSEFKALHFIVEDGYMDRGVFIDLNIISSVLFDGSEKQNDSYRYIVQQVIEYFDIVNNQKLYLKDNEVIINPFESWELRFDKSVEVASPLTSGTLNLLNYVPINTTPSDTIKVNGLIRPIALLQYIWFVVSHIAIGTYPWGLIHLRGVENSPISFNYKPHSVDSNKGSSVNDLYLLVFKQNSHIQLMCTWVVNENDANT